MCEATTPYLNREPRSLAEAEAARDDGDDDPPEFCECGNRIETSHERHYGACWLCLREDA